MCKGQGGYEGINKENVSKVAPVSFLQNSNNDHDAIYNFVFDQSTDAILVTDLKGNLKEVNDSACSLFGYSRSELIRLNIRQLLKPEDSTSKNIWADITHAGKNIFKRIKMHHKYDCDIDVELTTQKTFVDQLVVVARDVTNENGILKKSEAHLNTIFNTTDTIYVLLDTELRIVSYNPRAVNFVKNELGQNIEVNRYLLDYFPIERQPLLLNYMKAVLTGKHINYEISYPQHSGIFNWYYVRWLPISNGDNIYGLMMAVSDITEKKLLHEKLEEERLKKQMEITGAVITAQENERHAIGLELHDNVNQLLATAQIFACLAKFAKGKKTLDYLDEVDKHLTNAINEIRNLSHSMIPPLVDGSGLLDSLCYLVQTIRKVSDLTIKSEFKLDESLISNQLKLAIYRIVQEQLNNVLKHAKACSIILQLIQDNDKIMLSIKDNGVGFNPDVKSNGIGLVNIRTRASLANGKVEVISSPGNGCELIVNFNT